MPEQSPKIPHGFTVQGIVTLIFLGLIVWGIFYGWKVAPQVRSTANQVASLNNLKNIDFTVDGNFGWIPIHLKGKGNL